MEDHPFRIETKKISDSYRKAVMNVEIGITPWELNELKQQMSVIKTEARVISPLDVSGQH